jgi:hypothetical protein
MLDAHKIDLYFGKHELPRRSLCVNVIVAFQWWSSAVSCACSWVCIVESRVFCIKALEEEYSVSEEVLELDSGCDTSILVRFLLFPFAFAVSPFLEFLACSLPGWSS